MRDHDRKLVKPYFIFVKKVFQIITSAFPSTPSFSSLKSLTASSARDLPILDGPSRKKLLAASFDVAFEESRIVDLPIPGRTGF
jgi:hypothetical protein